jgi:hypothetical protein
MIIVVPGGEHDVKDKKETEKVVRFSGDYRFGTYLSNSQGAGRCDPAQQ